MVSKKFVKRQVTCIILLSFFFLYPFSAHALFGGKIDNYSADSVEISPQGKVVNTSKYYMTSEAIKIDGLPGQGSSGASKMNLSILILKKQDQQFFYNHDKKLVYESPVDKDNLGAGYKAMGNVDSETVLGKEKVSGYTCAKKEVVTSFTMMGFTTKTKLTVWESERFDLPLRIKDEEGGLQEIRNIKTGKPPKKHFQPLTGYKKVGNMMAVMGMDFNSERMVDEETSASPENPKIISENPTEETSQPPVPHQETPEKEQTNGMTEDRKKQIENALQDLGGKLKDFKF